MVYRGERAYPGRARRMARRSPDTRGATYTVCALLLLMAALLTMVWHQTQNLDRELTAAERDNAHISEDIEAYRTRLERAESYEEIIRRARELGLSQAETDLGVLIPDRM